jgi:hypothetical protein
VSDAMYNAPQFFLQRTGPFLDAGKNTAFRQTS